jgi:hypothetical protein
MPTDVNSRAAAIVALATSEDELPDPNEGKDSMAVARGLKGGAARAQALSPEERSRVARKAALARWRRDAASSTATVVLPTQDPRT